MPFNKFPEFGEQLKRLFEVHENCYDCAEFYDGCNAWPENKPFDCVDYYPLPDVMPGTCGQVFPPSRMQGRREPQSRRQRFPPTSRKLAAIPVGSKLEDQLEAGTTPSTAMGRLPQRPPRRTCRPSPIANRGLSGERLCECGAVLHKRRRCCDACRLTRREETMRQRRSREQPSAAVDAGSGVPFTHAGMLSKRVGGGAHS
jgi:hypothetical protein